MNCSKCGMAADPGSVFCEACGEPFPVTAASAVVAVSVAVSAATSPPAVCSCGAPQDKIDSHNVCTVCGEIVEPKKPRDHFDIRLDAARAAQSDLGRKHWRNEDFVAMATVDTATLVVVSDGVSSSERPDEASQGACTAAIESLKQASGDWTTAIKAAIEAAQTAVISLPWTADSKKEPPEATLLIIVVQDGQATIGWLGDSRAYAISQQDGATHATMLTQDHSWINEVVNAGEMTLDEALKDKRAHAVTQSLGQIPEGDTLDPSIKTVPLDGIQYVLGCSDGFWNYAHPQQDRPPQGLIGLFHQAAPDTEALDLARSCVDFANNHGGHDNISVAVVALPASKGPG